ncbi:MAG: FtsQ-type POTRA domain-containing protein [Acidobacteriota bacterium]|nr:FtsQ-type POTRA domain-containing protein [Blastocatellia bacterium]MDW8412259.1 FtsQ-type POTRA domain-containing protein [Acidobacteriota bacterium]
MRGVTAERRSVFKQKVIKRKSASGKVTRERLLSYLWVAVAGLVLFGVVIGIISAYRVVVRSEVFRLSSIEITGVRRVSIQDVERLLRESATDPLIFADLGKMRKVLEQMPWIKRAYLTRVLPDKLRVKVEERVPFMLVKIGSKLFWVDDCAVVLGEFDMTADKDVPPVVTGFSAKPDEISRAEDLERIATYKNILWALDSGTTKYLSQVEEIDLTNLKDVRITVVQGLGEHPVEIALGHRDFRARVALAMDILDALRTRDSARLRNYQVLDPQVLSNPELITFISVVHPAQIAIKLARKPVDSERADFAERRTEKAMQVASLVKTRGVSALQQKTATPTRPRRVEE